MDNGRMEEELDSIQAEVEDLRGKNVMGDELERNRREVAMDIELQRIEGESKDRSLMGYELKRKHEG